VIRAVEARRFDVCEPEGEATLPESLVCMARKIGGRLHLNETFNILEQ